jgi:hypothetical protein
MTSPFMSARNGIRGVLLFAFEYPRTNRRCGFDS